MVNRRLPEGSLEAAKNELVERLRSRSHELEHTILTHLRGTPDDIDDHEADVQFVIGQRETVVACLECWLLAVAHGGRWTGPVPPAVDIQARRAVRTDVSLSAALSRYVGAQALAWELVLEEVQHIHRSQSRVQLLREAWIPTASLLRCLVQAVCDAYTAESARYLNSREQRQGEIVRRLLAGEPGIDISGLAYDFDGHHLGLIAGGPQAKQAVETLADRLKCRLLSLDCGDGTVWAWLGSRSLIAAGDLDAHLTNGPGVAVSLTVGRLERGVVGFRLTHKHAKAALRVARLQPRRITWYKDVELIALALQDEDLARSMIAGCIAPIIEQRDGLMLLKTLQAFYASGRNQAQTGKLLSVDRHTVERHLRRIEVLISRPLPTCHANVELALRLYELWGSSEAMQ